MRSHRLRLASLLLLLLPPVTLADEGMWTLDGFPSQTVKKLYKVDIDHEWQEKIRLATTRLEGGCTGSFVSADGLVLTNHHCARRCVSQLSSASRDVEAQGFLAHNRDEEERCEADQISVLMDTEEITSQVSAATTGKPESEANEARKAVLTRLEQECEESSRAGGSGELSCESVSLYNGGIYYLYKYKRYSDVRLVFVPEAGIAAFGGDPDNFNFPRWCLDMSLLRVYEHGKPASTPHHLTVRAEGADAGEAVFVSGHPGSTERLLTMAELRFQRDVTLPSWLLRSAELRGRMIQYSRSSDEARRIVQSPLLGLENGIKVRTNEQRALLDDKLFTRKQAEEQELRLAVAARPDLADVTGSWDAIDRALETYRTFRAPFLFLEQRAGFDGSMFGYARTLLRAAEERVKPNEKRLRGYTEAALPGGRQRMLAARPIYPELEILRLSHSLDKMREWLGPDDPTVKAVLGKQSPEALATAMVEGTGLADPDVRRVLWDGGREMVLGSTDPMIRLAMKIDHEARALRLRYENEVEAVLDTHSEKIARARFAVQGTSRYPDATFSLRVSYGSVKGWLEKGQPVDPFTSLGALYPRVTGEEPFRLPASWLEARSRLDAKTRFNFVADTDITGGNSGSPMVDAQGRLVGLVFDGNIHSIAGSYWFDESLNRTVAVHPAIMMEALRSVYKADALVQEITRR